MARITVEDSRTKIRNKFELVVLTAQRVRELSSGAKPTIQSKNKDVVVALREIAEGKIIPAVLQETLISRYQTRRKIEQDDPYTNGVDLFNNEEALQSFNDTASGIEQGVAVGSDVDFSAIEADEDEIEIDEQDGNEEASLFDDEEKAD